MPTLTYVCVGCGKSYFSPDYEHRVCNNCLARTARILEHMDEKGKDIFKHFDIRLVPKKQNMTENTT